MLTEEQIKEIQAGAHLGIRGPILTKWLEMLLKERDERLKRDKEIAARLLAVVRAVEEAR